MSKWLDYRNASIKHKIMLIIMVISTISLIVACTFFLIFDTFQTRKLMANDLLLKAKIIANQHTASLTFLTPHTAVSELKGLKDDSHIEAAVIYTPDSAEFATYFKEGFENKIDIPPLQEDGHEYFDDHIELFTSIYDEDIEGAVIGKLFLRSDLAIYQERLTTYVFIIAGVLLISLFIAFVLSSRFQMLISKPLLFLTKKAMEISVNKDYSIRIKKYTNDEVGGLIESFNDMLKEIEKQNVTLDEQLRLITETNTQITDSINYAKRIQEAMLPVMDKFKSYLPDLFVLFKPKDIVSGDFYWAREKKGYLYIAAVDCTGHGVPGALMSMIGSNVLNGIINGTTDNVDVDIVLNKLNVGVKKALKQNRIDSNSQDGMDIALCRVDRNNRILQYAGANNPLYYYKANKLEIIKADKYPIGGNQYQTDITFTKHELNYQEGDVVYIFSDGYPDQFGGSNDKKFTNRRIREILKDIYKESMDQQYAVLDEAFKEWKGKTEQTDDVLMIGFRL